MPVPVDLTSGITTTSELDSTPPGLRVTWIAWDSGFASSGLRVGDHITAIDGKLITRPAAQEDVQRMLPQLIGQYAELQGYSAANVQPGASVTLTVRRRAPQQGWETAACSGALHPITVYTTADGQRALAPNGPAEMQSDGFDESWGPWHETKIVRNFHALLDGAWQSVSFNNRFELTQHLLLKDRLDFLNAHYPGPFAQFLTNLWTTVRDSLQGPAYNLTEADIKFRRSEEEKVQQSASLASQSWAACLQTAAPETIPAFPSVDPITGDRKGITGKLIVLPAIRPADWLEQAGKTYFAFGSPETGFYFADAESADAQAMLLAVQRVRRLVTPAIDESYEMLGRVLNSVSLRMYAGRAYYGIDVEIVAALVGRAMFVDVMFVDVAQRQDALARFAGEDFFDMPMHALPLAAASPKETMEAFFGALKTGDLKLWKALFADWSVGYLPDGHPLIYPHDIRIDENLWEDSRRNLLSKIFDLRVGWIGDTNSITTGHEFPNAPHIEEVAVEIDIIGSFDGQYRKFAGVSLARFWSLQRIDGGPWRISSVQRL